LGWGKLRLYRHIERLEVYIVFMQLLNHCWIYPQAIPKRVCDHIITEGLQYSSSGGETGLSMNLKKYPSIKKHKLCKKIRHSDVSFFQDNKWIHNLMNPYMVDANRQSEWNFNINASEKYQFTTYKLNQHYAWHQDGFKQPFPPGHEHAGLIRKLSFSLVLSDKVGYKGGDLCFSYVDQEKKKVEIKHTLEMGTVVVFPSFVWHKVEPVIKGTRFSLVGWYLGESFK